jgi:serine/threonine protein kinase
MTAGLRPGDALRGTSGRSYRICSWHAEGSYSRLYRARDDAARPYAVKLARGEVADAAPRLEREAAIRRIFRHAAVPELRDTGEVAGVPFLALAWVEGGTLRALLEGRRGLPLVRALELTHAVAGVVAGMHAADLAHGDLRADNVLVARPGELPAAHVADLGSALRRGEPGWDAARSDDQRRLAALFYQMLAGAPPEVSPGVLAVTRGQHPGAVRLWETARDGSLPPAHFLREIDALRRKL